MSHNIDFDRRRFLGAALAAFGVPELVANRSDSAQSGSGTPAATTNGMARTSDSLGTLKQVAAGVLNVGYADAGPANGRPVILLHGWPYDIHSFIDVVPLLASAGYRVIVPYLRGYGTTSFLSSDTLRNGQQAALALDVIALMDALGIDKAVVAGFDWGARTANIMAVLWPERCNGNRRRQRLSDCQSRGEPAAADAAGRVCLVVPVLLRDRTGRARLQRIPTRLQQAHLEARVAEMAVR